MRRIIARLVSAIVITVVAGCALPGLGETIENRDGRSLIASWWGSDSSWPYVYELDFGSTQRVHTGKYALKITYDKSRDPGNPYSFISAMGGFNLRNFDYLSFWVYNNGAPLKFRIRLEDRNGNPWESNWAGIEPRMTTTNANWENLVLDLTRTFSATSIDMTAIAQIMFIAQPGDTNSAGEFWLDDIEAQVAPNASPLDSFESDYYGWSAGSPFSISNTTESFYNAGTATGIGQYALKVSWGNKSNGYQNFTYSPCHDTNTAPAGRIGNYPNFKLNNNKTLELWVRSTSETNMPILLKFNDKDVGTKNYTTRGSWQKLSWVYTNNTAATNVQTVWFFPYPNATDTGGTMYVDNLNLVGGSARAVPLAPTSIWTTATVPDGDGIYTVRWASVSGVSGYELQQSLDVNFTNVWTTNTTALYVRFAKSPVTPQGSTYHYRVRSRIVSGGVTNRGSFTVPVAATVKQIPAAARNCEVIENFNGSGLVASWWASDPSAPYAYTLDYANTQRVHSGAAALKVTFNKANDSGSPYSFFSASGLFNLRNHDFLSFWAWNNGSALKFRIRLEDQAGNPWESNWADIEPAMQTATSGWENLVVDLTRTFSAGSIDMTAIRQIMFMVQPGSTNAAGEFWMDDVAVHRAANSAPLEAFESDFYGWAAGAPFVLARTNTEFRNDGTLTGLGQFALKVSWTNKPAGYANFTYEPAHDAAVAPSDRIGDYPNFALNANTFAELWVKSATESNMPILLKLDGADVSTQTYTNRGNWQRLTWDYSGVAGRTAVTRAYFYPYPNAADANGGTIYVDDFNLIGGAGPVLPAAPTGLGAASPSENVYTFTWNAVAGATKYELQESADPNFGSAAGYVVTAASATVTNRPTQTTYTYYRVRSCVPEGGQDNWGSACKPIFVQVPPVPVEQAEVVESFDGSTLVTAWWAGDPAAPQVYQLDFANDEHVKTGAASLKVTFDKANDPDAYSFFSAAGHYNLRNFDYLSFWIYNDGSPLQIKVRIEDGDGQPWESDWAGIFPRVETGAADWENLVVDLSRTFGATNVDWTDVRQIMFMVEPGSATASGTFWMDDLRLRRAVNSAPLDAFEADVFGWQGDGPFGVFLATNECRNDGSAAALGQHALRVTWGAKSADYSRVDYDPAHDAAAAPAGRIGDYTDWRLNGNGVVEIWVKSATESSLPILAKLDDAELGVQTYAGAGAWRRLQWTYSAVPGATNVARLHLFPYPNQSDGGGTFYADDLNLVGGGAQPVPLAPGGLHASAVDQGHFTVSWDAVPAADNYELEESVDPSFTEVTGYYPSGAFVDVYKDPATQFGTHYYRVRSNVRNGGPDNYGSFSLPITVVVPRYVATEGQVENRSYGTSCAEMDNVNVPVVFTNLDAYRITVTHPVYYPTTINERGPDFEDCEFTDRNIWRIGTNDDSWAEFRQSGFNGWDEYFAEDKPAAGVDEPWSEFPLEINNDWMNLQYIRFTADEDSDVNLEVKIGAKLTVDFAMLAGQLEIRAWTWNGAGWTDQGTRIFNSGAMTRSWDIPDFSWVAGTDANNLVLDVVTSGEGGQSWSGSWAIYDHLELRKRDEAGETAPVVLFDDEKVKVETIGIDFWWRAPDGMDVSVAGGGAISNVQYFRIVKRVPDTNTVEYSQVLVLYEDGYARLLPHPPAGVDWTPFGASVILGPSENSARPFCGIRSVAVDPRDLSLDIVYESGETAHVELWADREMNVVDVTGITYQRATNSFARLRSMWVYDGKADLDRVESRDGVFPILGDWYTLGGTWWQFFKETPSYHNTYCPDVRVEIMEPEPAFLVREAESLDGGTNYVVSNRDNARGGQTITMSAEGGEAGYNITLAQNQPATHLVLRYADDDGGDNGAYRGNLVQVYVDGELKGETRSANTGGWDVFENMPAVYLGDLEAGSHTIRIVTGPLTFGVDLDSLAFVSQPVAAWTRSSILTRQAETLDSGSNYVVAWRSNAVGGQTIAMSLNGASARYDLNLAQACANAYVQVRYADDVGPNKVEVYLDGWLAARYPTESTGGWNSFDNSAEMWLGDLAAGSHTLEFVTSAETWGVDLDQFELFGYTAP